MREASGEWSSTDPDVVALLRERLVRSTALLSAGSVATTAKGAGSRAASCSAPGPKAATSTSETSNEAA